MAELRLEAVAKSFGDIEAVRSLTLEVAAGELVALLGPTGAGKTTTLRLVAGLERADAGKVFIAGADVTAEPPATRNVAFVFQQYSLYPHMSVFDNLAFPLRSPRHRTPEAEIARRVRQVSDMLHIGSKLQNSATELSGGEMQRVSIGRALVREPDIYLMDEPLSSLDAKLRAELRLELKGIQASVGATMLYVTHDQVEAMTMADRVGVLREGELVQVGTPQQLYLEPADSYVATRLGMPQINFFPCGLLPTPGAPAAAQTVGARTEHLRIGPSTAGQGTIGWIEHLGNENHLHIDIGDHHIVALSEPGSTLAPGDRVAVELDDPLYFDQQGLCLNAGSDAPSNAG